MEVVVKILVGFGLIIAVGIIVAFPVKWLWNWLMPLIFELREITFWQALGLLLLSGLLFRSNSNSK